MFLPREVIDSVVLLLVMISNVCLNHVGPKYGVSDE
jgi:hypothetical protein